MTNQFELVHAARSTSFGPAAPGSGMFGGIQLICKSFLLEFLPLAQGESQPDLWHVLVFLASDGFIIQGQSHLSQKEMRKLGRSLLDLVQNKAGQMSFLSPSRTLYLAVHSSKEPGSFLVSGHLLRSSTGIVSAFESLVTPHHLRRFAKELQRFPHPTSR
ncbi:MAG: hypothetical protein NZM37_03710 [Sandaracinaceae bacterium]|nr:hypothetical protein [Sandaracinaceae bacterium]MDW8245521.1 hypothetical protein [Sandaracinaceae bacterium]